MQLVNISNKKATNEQQKSNKRATKKQQTSNKRATNEQQKSFDKINTFYFSSIIKQQKTVQINRTVPVIYELN